MTASIRERLAWHVWTRMPEGISSKAATYSVCKRRRLTPEQTAEVWQYVRGKHPFIRIGLTNAVTPNGIDGVMAMVRADVDGDYLSETPVDGAYPYTPGWVGRQRGVPNPTRPPGGLAPPILGYQDVIDMSNAGVPAKYGVAVLGFGLTSADAVELHESNVPLAYVRKAGIETMEFLRAGVPFEYLV